MRKTQYTRGKYKERKTTKPEVEKMLEKLKVFRNEIKQEFSMSYYRTRILNGNQETIDVLEKAKKNYKESIKEENISLKRQLEELRNKVKILEETNSANSFVNLVLDIERQSETADSNPPRFLVSEPVN